MKEILKFVKDIRPGCHIVLFYDTLGFKHKVLFTCLRACLQRRIAVLYLSHKESTTKILECMSLFGIDVGRYAKAGLFELWEITPDFYAIGDRSSNNMLFNGHTDATLLKSYYEGRFWKCMLVVEDDPLQNVPSQIVVDLEKMHHERLMHLPMSLICTYSIRKVSTEENLFLDLVETHQHIIIQTYGTLINLQND